MIFSCTPFMVLRKATSVEKTFVILFGIHVNRKLRFENYFYCVLITAKGNVKIMKVLTTLCNHPFIWTFYLPIFHYITIFNGFISLVSVYAITYVHSLACVFIFDSCLMYILLGMTYICYVG